MTEAKKKAGKREKRSRSVLSSCCDLLPSRNKKPLLSFFLSLFLFHSRSCVAKIVASGFETKAARKKRDERKKVAEPAIASRIQN